MKDATINVRIENWIYQETRKQGVNISQVVRDALIAEVERRKKENFKEKLLKAQAALKKIKMKDIVEDIREMRESR
ncbi:type II toxin-antitoxin system CcdA family antitoxin [Candidatus Micrarchaeota archaeon]|nr:type II toxin-antitoxin system CcdA family antitoxin [Candidatus Micrarchaeota archaeon]